MIEGKTSKRLSFQQVNESHKPHLIEFFSNPDAVKYLGCIADINAHADKWVENIQKRYEHDGSSLYAVLDKNTNEFLGQCGILKQTLDGEDEMHYEVGYHFQPKHWGNGYATEAAIFCRDYIFESGLAEQVISIIHPENLPSQAVAKRNGMKVWREASFRETPVLIFGIEKGEWENLKR